VSYFSLYQANFCCPVRTLRERDEEGRWRQRTPAMAAGLTDHGVSATTRESSDLHFADKCNHLGVTP
jgi:hypothetical protein